MRCNEQELKPIGYFVDAILDGHARHAMFPFSVVTEELAAPGWIDEPQTAMRHPTRSSKHQCNGGN
jgi:hypothetical protein